MNKTFNKSNALLAAIVCLFLAGLSGCGSKEDTSSTDTSGAKAGSTAPATAPATGAPTMATPMQAAPANAPASK